MLIFFCNVDIGVLIMRIDMNILYCVHQLPLMAVMISAVDSEGHSGIQLYELVVLVC